MALVAFFGGLMVGGKVGAKYSCGRYFKYFDEKVIDFIFSLRNKECNYNQVSPPGISLKKAG